MNKRIRQYIGLFSAVLMYYIIHEGAHLIYALSVGAFRQINFMGLGVQIGIYEEQMSNLQLGIFCLSGTAATMVTAYVLILTASQICKADSKIFKACLYYITIAMLLIDPLYLSIWLRWISGAGRGKKRRRDGRLHRLIPLSRLLEAGHLHRRGKLRLLHRHGDKSRWCGPLWPELRLGGM